MNTNETVGATAACTGNKHKSAADIAGMTASIACAIHCAAMPLVIGYLPTLGLSWLVDESFHQVMAVVCFVLAVVAFAPGWRNHGSVIPALVGLTGVLMLTLAAYGSEGACCPSCSNLTATPTNQAASKCDYCQLCQAADGPAATVEEVLPSQTGWESALITPLGGVLLVFGHLVNHRKSCHCNCRQLRLWPVTSTVEATASSATELTL